MPDILQGSCKAHAFSTPFPLDSSTIASTTPEVQHGAGETLPLCDLESHGLLSCSRTTHIPACTGRSIFADDPKFH